MLVTVAVTGISSLTNIGAQKIETPAITQSVSLLFADDADGGVSVYDFNTGNRVWVYPPESGGFVRTAMRAVVFARKKRGIGPEEPFILSRAIDGRLILSDPLTDKTIALDAFGASNAAEFAKLIGHDEKATS